jgi:hypothetical protein
MDENEHLRNGSVFIYTAEIGFFVVPPGQISNDRKATDMHEFVD